ncbi:unnamed protein product [Enterobius vermicularis]|uniref:Nucleoside-diphosphatase uda-1 n=1 Tax=Enterobius vermicularis TaxID=51028 RepID=A0A0N4V8B7_ENTVE|nr:unnamed protein product [Enterobius vermicularis]
MISVHRISIFSLTAVCISVVVSLYADSLFVNPCNDAKSLLLGNLTEKDSNPSYVAVIDAGSTGTRLHLFEFQQTDSLQFDVKKENFKEVKPGLSSFVADPDGAGDSVQELLDTAHKIVPESCLRQTPMILRATAGLRLLKSSESEAILKKVTASKTVSGSNKNFKVKERVNASGFLVSEDSVAVLSGTEEGVFSWFTLNVLLDRMKHIDEAKKECFLTQESVKPTKSLRKLAAALDLGGGSTQVTFLPYDHETVALGIDRQEFSHKIKVFGKMAQLYTHSYLSNGLIAARHGITKELQSLESGHYLSSCFPTGYMVESLDYSGRKWSVQGYASSFEGCLNSTKLYVEKTGIRVVPELTHHDIYAFSYFYDRGLQAQLVPRATDSRGGSITVGDYMRAAKRACSRKGSDIGVKYSEAWKCLDLSYIYSLLHYGYGLKNEKEIYVRLAKRLRDMEVSWALGASYDLINTLYQTESKPLIDDLKNDTDELRTCVYLNV